MWRCVSAGCLFTLLVCDLLLLFKIFHKNFLAISIVADICWLQLQIVRISLVTAKYARKCVCTCIVTVTVLCIMNAHVVLHVFVFVVDDVVIFA